MCPDATISEVTSRLASCSPMTAQSLASQGLSRVSLGPIDTVNAVDSCCPNVERAKREVIHPRFRPDGLLFHTGGFRLQVLIVIGVLAGYFLLSLFFLFSTCRVQHSNYASTCPLSILFTFAYPGVASHRFYCFTVLSSFRVPPFFAAAMSQLFCRGQGCHGKRFRLLRRRSMAFYDTVVV